MSGEPQVIVAPNAETVGRQVRRVLDDGRRVAGFVGDVDADQDLLDEFVRDVVRDES